MDGHANAGEGQRLATRPGEEWRVYGTQADPRCRARLVHAGHTYVCGNDAGTCLDHAPVPVPASWPVARHLTRKAGE